MGEKSAIEQERDDNDEALVAANQKLKVLEKIREDEKKELEDVRQQLTLKEKALNFATKKIKEQDAMILRTQDKESELQKLRLRVLNLETGQEMAKKKEEEVIKEIVKECERRV